ncbi:MAG: hypothetical protein DIU80_006670 [Chloroflexota bacterium]
MDAPQLPNHGAEERNLNQYNRRRHRLQVPVAAWRQDVPDDRDCEQEERRDCVPGEAVRPRNQPVVQQRDAEKQIGDDREAEEGFGLREGGRGGNPELDSAERDEGATKSEVLVLRVSCIPTSL